MSNSMKNAELSKSIKNTLTKMFNLSSEEGREIVSQLTKLTKSAGICDPNQELVYLLIAAGKLLDTGANYGTELESYYKALKEHITVMIKWQ